MSQSLTVALAQYPSGRDCEQIVAEAKAAAAGIVVFPEMYSNGYARFDPNDPAARARWCAGVESLDGDFVGRFREAARAYGVHVVAPFLEKAEPKPFNAALLIDAGGRALLHHRKVHICAFDSPEPACGHGSGFTPCDIETAAGAVRVGLMICMDRSRPRRAIPLLRAPADGHRLCRLHRLAAPPPRHRRPQSAPALSAPPPICQTPATQPRSRSTTAISPNLELLDLLREDGA
jgi:predicted amidohydrolase